MPFLISGICLATIAFGAVAHAQDAGRQKTVVILLGPPGSGKGTQAKRIVESLQIPHISTGDLFRKHVREETSIGKKVQHLMESGQYVPDEIVFDILFERINQTDAQNGYLLDGFPRTLNQAKELDNRIRNGARIIVINLDVSDETVIKRISGRFSCKDCGQVYNTYEDPPRKEGVCDRCGGELVQRPDDRPEVIKDRLEVYHKQTKPLLDYYGDRDTFLKIDGEKNPEEITREILNHITQV